MTANPAPRLVTEFKPKFEVKVDLDDRAFLFPAGKTLAQFVFVSDGKWIFVEAVYPFNQTRTPPRLLTLDLDDARDIGRGQASASRSTSYRTDITCRLAT